MYAIVTLRGCEMLGCSNQTGDPNSSPVDFLYNSIGIEAIVEHIKFLHLATEGTLIAASRDTLVKVVGR